MIIGITGAIGSGKSIVGKYISQKGYFVIDSDVVSHDIIKKDKPAYQEIINYFGKEILDDDFEINRKKLGSIVFNNEEKRLKLNEIMHNKVLEELQRMSYNCSIVFWEVPLLFETEFINYVDEIILVYSDNETVLKRIMQRDNIDRESAKKRLNKFIDIDYKIKHSQYLIENNNDLENLYKKCDNILNIIKSKLED